MSSSSQSYTTAPPPNIDHRATHHLCIGNLSTDNCSGRIKITYPDLLLGPGILMVTFYDLREAAVALESINSSEYQERVRATYISDVQLATLSNTPPQDSRSARTVIVTLCGAHDRLVEFNYKVKKINKRLVEANATTPCNCLTQEGATRHIIDVEFSGSRCTIEVEYFDLRAPSRITAALHNHACQ
ncbi:hypothetical protein BDB00DRAFT_828214, partial [Zychaea mexicana]|uniref:uncharacterized protein n=1 Tax=Zychaea mexicana TaxID=64656 RepID=UPI0022FDC05E